MEEMKHEKQSTNQSWHPNIWPPFTQITSSIPPRQIQNAFGAILLQDNGPPIIDAISSWWVTLHGHANPYIALSLIHI